MSESLLPNILEFISQTDPFDKLPNDLQAQIAGTISICYLGRGEHIDFDPEHAERYLYIIRTGVMEQRKPNGLLRSKLGPQDLFGFTFISGQTDHEESYSAIAVESTLLYLVPHAHLQTLLTDHPEYAEHFADQAQIRLKNALDVVWSDKDKGIYLQKVADVATNIPAVVDADMSIQSVAKEMRYNSRTPMAIVKKNGEIVGVMTDRDMTKRVIADGVDPTSPVSDVMTRSPLTIGPNDLVLSAVSIMMQHRIRSLPVVQGESVIGLLTLADMVQKNRVQAIFLIDSMKRAKTVKQLTALTQDRQAIFEALVDGKVRSQIISEVMTMIYDAYTRRLIHLAQKTLGPAPCEFAWIVAGSHARKETHISSDQDNAIIISNDVTPEQIPYFSKLADFVCQALGACGFILCPGNFMASNQQWTQPLTTWRNYYQKWISTPDQDSLLYASVFLETRCIFGEESYNDQLQTHLYTLINKHPNFLSILINDAVSVSPPLGIFNSLVVEKTGANSNTLNVKKYAITLVVDLARIYGLASGCTETSTEARFKHAYKQGILSEDALKNIIGAYRFIGQLRFAHQLESLKLGETPNNQLCPTAFGSFERKHLKDAFRIIAKLQEVAKLKFS